MCEKLTDLDSIASELSYFHGVDVTEEMLEEFSETQQDLFLHGYENMLTYDVWQESLEDLGYELAEKVAKEFKKTFNWDAIKEEFKTAEVVESFDFNNPTRCLWLGTVFACTPSGKVYAPYANSNATWFAAMCDEAWQEILDGINIDGAFPYWGDSGDLFLIREESGEEE